MPFLRDLRDLRRRSRSFHPDAISNDSSGSNESADIAPTSKSTSSLGSSAETSATPASFHRSNSNLTLPKLHLTHLPSSTTTNNDASTNDSSSLDAVARPEYPQQSSYTSRKTDQPSPLSSASLPIRRSRPNQLQHKRVSTAGSLSFSLASGSRSAQSSHAPHIESITDNAWVHHKFVLIYGTCGLPQRPVDGLLVISHGANGFPPQKWPVCEGHFKALVPLVPGSNHLQLTFTAPDLKASPSSTPHVSRFRINYLPPLQTPPLHLAVLLGRDSAESNDEILARKMRIAATLWQAFLGEAMHRNGLGRRSFRFEEAWQRATLSQQQSSHEVFGSEIKVHVVRSHCTVTELRASVANKSTLPAIALEDLRRHLGSTLSDYKHRVSVLLGDAHSMQPPLARNVTFVHEDADLQMAMLASDALHAYPTCMEEVVPILDGSFEDTSQPGKPAKQTDSRLVAWSVSAALGEHFRATARLFNASSSSPEDDYLRDLFLRSFVIREPAKPTSQISGMTPCLPRHEPALRHLDALRLRLDPYLRLPSDPPLPSEEEDLLIWPVDRGTVIAVARSGIAFVEVWTPDATQPAAHLDYSSSDALRTSGSSTSLDKLGGSDMAASQTDVNEWMSSQSSVRMSRDGGRREVLLRKSELRKLLPRHLQKKLGKQPALRLEIYAHGLHGAKHATVHDFGAAGRSVSLPHKRQGFPGPIYGKPIPTAGSHVPHQSKSLLLHSTTSQNMRLRCVRTHCTSERIFGLDFVWEDGTVQSLGTRADDAGQSREFCFDTRRGEVLLGFYLRYSPSAIHALGLLTTLGRRSDIYGAPSAGRAIHLVQPRGFQVAGLQAVLDPTLCGFGVILAH